MKKINFIIIILLSITAASVVLSISCNSEMESQTEADTLTPENPLIGEWRLIQAEFIFPDTSFTIDSTDFYSIYMIGDRHFSFFYSTPDKQTLTGAGRGTYLLEGSKYIENVEFHSTPYIIGTSVIFESKVEGDLWIHEGFLPVREEDKILAPFAKGNPTFQLIEKRRRVKALKF